MNEDEKVQTEETAEAEKPAEEIKEGQKKGQKGSCQGKSRGEKGRSAKAHSGAGAGKRK